MFTTSIFDVQYEKVSLSDSFNLEVFIANERYWGEYLLSSYMSKRFSHLGARHWAHSHLVFV